MSPPTRLAQRALLARLQQEHFPDGIHDRAAYRRLQELTLAWLREHGYRLQPVSLSFPDVPFDQEGAYYLPLPAVATEQLTAAFQRHSRVHRYRPDRVVSLVTLASALAPQIGLGEWRALPDADAGALLEQIRQLAPAAGYRVESDELSQPLPPDLDAARQAIRDYLARSHANLRAAGLHHAVTRAAYGEGYLIDRADPDDLRAFASLLTVLDEELARHGYSPRLADGVYPLQPLPLPADIQARARQAISNLAPIGGDDGPLLLAAEVETVLAQAAGYAAETLPDLRRRELLDSPWAQAALTHHRWEAAPHWRAARDFTPPRDAGAYAYRRDLRPRRDPQFTLDLSRSGGLPVHIDRLTLDPERGLLLCLGLVGPLPAVRANWAGLVNGAGENRYLDGSRLVLKGMQDHILLKRALPVGYVHWVLLHKQAAHAHLQPGQPCYLLDDGSRRVPAGFYPFLDKACPAPFMPAWADYLWDAGREQSLLELVTTRRSQNYGAWLLQPDPAAWQALVADGLRQGHIIFQLDDPPATPPLAQPATVAA